MEGPSSLSVAEILEHEAFVRGLARAALGADDHVDDVVQETLAAGVSRRGLFDVRGWLATVARRRSVDHLRREATRRRHEQAVSRAAVRITPAPAEILAHEEARRALVEELVALDPPSREVLVLRYFEDLPPREIAARLGVPVETVRTRTKRALARLHERLDVRHGGDRRRWAAPLAAAVGFTSMAAVAVSSATGGLVPWLLGAAAVVALGTGAVLLTRDDDGPAPSPEPLASASGAADRPRLEGSARPLDAAPIERGTCRILGWVTRNGHPVVATVELRRVPGIGAAEMRAGVRAGSRDAKDAPLGRVQTDARGGYEFAGLPPGIYRLTAILASGTTGETGAWLEFVGQAGAGNIPLADGPHVLTGRVVDPEGAPVVAEVMCIGPEIANASYAHRPAVATDAEGRFAIAGLPEGQFYVSATPLAAGANSGYETVYVPADGPVTVSLSPSLPEPAPARGRVEGVVLDPRGKPVADVRVRSQFARLLTERPNDRASAITDAAGRFVLEGLGVGFVRLAVHERGWTTPGLLDARDGADPLLLATDAEGRAKAVLRVVRSGSLRGSVRDAEGVPLVGAVVRAGHERFGPPDDLMQASAVSGGDGRFTIDTFVPDTEVLVSASSPELVDRVYATVRTPIEGDVQVDLSGTRLDPSRWIEVEVREEATNALAADARVSIQTAEGGTVFGPIVIGAVGRALLGPLPAGNLAIEVRGPGILDEQRRPAVFPSTLVMVKRRPFVRGRVQMPRGREGTSARLSVEAVDPDSSTGAELSEWEDRVEMDGTFDLTPPPGRWRLRASMNVGEVHYLAEAIVEPGDHDVVLRMEPRAEAPASTVEVEGARPRHEWRISVLDPAGVPVPGATVAVWHVSPEHWEWKSFGVEAEGETYAYWGDPTQAWFEARDPEDALERPLPLAPALAGPHDLSRGGGSIELRLGPEKHIRGVVRDAAGAPLRGAHVAALARWPGMVAVHPTALAKHGRVLTDAEGRFELRGLADLDYELRLVVPRGYLAPEEPVIVRAGATDVALVVIRTASPVVTLLDERGEPVTGVRVLAVPVGRKLELHEEHEAEDDLPGVAAAVSDARGHALLRGLAPDRACDLRVGDPHYQGPVFDHRIDSWIPADTTLRLQRILEVRGRVLGTDGTPLPGARVTTDSDKHGALADADGRFRISGLRAGRYRLVARYGAMPDSEPVEAAAGAEDVVLRVERGLDFEVRITDWTPRWSETHAEIAVPGRKHPVGGGGVDPDSKGVLRWGGYPAGSRLSFRLRTRNSAHVVVRKDLPVGEPTTVALEPGAEIRGRLSGPGGAVPPNPGLSAATDDGIYLETKLEEDGTFVVQGLRRGERVRVTGWGGPLDAQRRATCITRLTDVEAGTTLDVEVRPP